MALRSSVREIFQGTIMLWMGWKFGIPLSDQQRDRQYTELLTPVWADAIIARMTKWNNRKS